MKRKYRYVRFVNMRVDWRIYDLNVGWFSRSEENGFIEFNLWILISNTDRMNAHTMQLNWRISIFFKRNSINNMIMKQQWQQHQQNYGYTILYVGWYRLLAVVCVRKFFFQTSFSFNFFLCFGKIFGTDNTKWTNLKLTQTEIVGK